MCKIEKIEKILKNYFFNEKVEIKNLKYIDNHYTVIFKIKSIVTLFITIDNDNIDLSFIDINFNNYYTIDDIIELSNKLKNIKNILNK